jgi:hypothetical protein
MTDSVEIFVKFLRSHSYFYGATHISTESVIFLRSHSYFYGAGYISTEPLIFLRSQLYFYGATRISTEPVIFLRSHSYFYGASYISMEHACFHGAFIFQWSNLTSVKSVHMFYCVRLCPLWATVRTCLTGGVNGFLSIFNNFTFIVNVEIMIDS